MVGGVILGEEFDGRGRPSNGWGVREWGVRELKVFDSWRDAASSVPFRVADFDIEEAVHPLESSEAGFVDSVGIIFQDERLVCWEEVPVTASEFTFELSGAPAGVSGDDPEPRDVLSCGGGDDGIEGVFAAGEEDAWRDFPIGATESSAVMEDEHGFGFDGSPEENGGISGVHGTRDGECMADVDSGGPIDNESHGTIGGMFEEQNNGSKEVGVTEVI